MNQWLMIKIGINIIGWSPTGELSPPEIRIRAALLMARNCRWTIQGVSLHLNHNYKGEKMISYQTTVSVPKHIIQKIGAQIRHLVTGQMLSERHQHDRWEQNDIGHVSSIIDDAVKAFANTEQKSCDGWSLTVVQAEIIAFNLREERFVEAIKEFRSATGSGLREAKEFMDKFGRGTQAAMEFLNTFV
jgi:ribosomal protein L7/L12